MLRASRPTLPSGRAVARSKIEPFTIEMRSAICRLSSVSSLGLRMQRCDDASIRNGDCQPVDRPRGRDEAAVPEPEAELQAELVMRLGEKAAQGRRRLSVISMSRIRCQSLLFGRKARGLASVVPLRHRLRSRWRYPSLPNRHSAPARAAAAVELLAASRHRRHGRRSRRGGRPPGERTLRRRREHLGLGRCNRHALIGLVRHFRSFPARYLAGSGWSPPHRTRSRPPRGLSAPQQRR